MPIYKLVGVANTTPNKCGEYYIYTDNAEGKVFEVETDEDAYAEVEKLQGALDDFFLSVYQVGRGLNHKEAKQSKDFIGRPILMCALFRVDVVDGMEKEIPVEITTKPEEHRIYINLEDASLNGDFKLCGIDLFKVNSILVLGLCIEPQTEVTAKIPCRIDDPLTFLKMLKTFLVMVKYIEDGESFYYNRTLGKDFSVSLVRDETQDPGVLDAYLRDGDDILHQISAPREAFEELTHAIAILFKEKSHA